MSWDMIASHCWVKVKKGKESEMPQPAELYFVEYSTDFQISSDVGFGDTYRKNPIHDYKLHGACVVTAKATQSGWAISQ